MASVVNVFGKVNENSVSVKQKKRMNEINIPELNFTEIGKRIKILRGDMQQIDFANLLGLERQQDVSKIENAKTKPSLEFLLKISVHFKKSFQWLLTGQDDIYPNGNKTINSIMESLPRYTSPNNSSLPDLSPEHKDALRYAIKAYEILVSGTGYANALRENITWFRRAVENEKRILRLEDDLSSLKKQLLESGIL